MTYRLILFLSGLLTLSWQLSLAQNTSPLLHNAYNRPARLLNGAWHYIIDPYQMGYYNYRYQAFDQMETPNREAYFMNTDPTDKSDRIEYDFDRSPTLNVPGDWNSQAPELLYYEGSVWYQTTFDYLAPTTGQKLLLHFGAVNYLAEVYLNGKKLGRHLGGFTPFNFEISQLIKEKDNSLVVKVDNTRQKEGVPTLNTDWWNYGGITRDVKLIVLPATYIQDYRLQLAPEDPSLIKGYVQLAGELIDQQEVQVRIKEMDLEIKAKTDQNGFVEIEIPTDAIQYWSPDNPLRYSIEISSKEDRIRDQIGFRVIQTEGSNILLNGEKIFLKGISLHEEIPQRAGRAFSRQDAQYLLEEVKALGCNFVRLAHYPHNENMLRLADQLGLLVWEEIPVYWTIDWENPATYDNAEQQLSELIHRDKNRASVIVWSVANETPVTEVRNRFLLQLIRKARQLDPSRLISAALEIQSLQESPNLKTVLDPLAETVDLLSFNQYIGWYDGLPDKAGRINWRFSEEKPVFISEFGAGALHGFHADPLTRWSEEYQEYVYRENLNMIERIPGIAGFSPWILFDFRSPRRNLAGIQDGWNRKGLISNEGEKKMAYFVLKEYYSNQ
jgi:beta-glucuronidase